MITFYYGTLVYWGIHLQYEDTVFQLLTVRLSEVTELGKVNSP
jgi:hypothetical protein